MADALAGDGVVNAGWSPRSGPHRRVEVVDGRLRKDRDVLVAVERDAGRKALELGELGIEVRRTRRLRNAVSGVRPAGGRTGQSRLFIRCARDSRRGRTHMMLRRATRMSASGEATETSASHPPWLVWVDRETGSVKSGAFVSSDGRMREVTRRTNGLRVWEGETSAKTRFCGSAVVTRAVRVWTSTVNCKSAKEDLQARGRGEVGHSLAKLPRCVTAAPTDRDESAPSSAKLLL